MLWPSSTFAAVAASLLLPVGIVIAIEGAPEECFEPRDVAFVDSDFVANGAYWKKRCKVIAHSDVDMVMITMGENRDFFRPNADESWCEMFHSQVAHLWTPNPKEGKWFRPQYQVPQSTHYGGSKPGWLSETTGSKRSVVSFWGSDEYAGGCCGNQEAELDDPQGSKTAAEAGWGIPFSVTTCRRCGTLEHLMGGQQMGAKFWEDVCLNLPSAATMVRITLGSVTDYFKPKTGSLCSMLKANNNHLWSSDGYSWKEPQYSSDPDHLGGSAEGWPRKNIEGDKRKYLTFWGSSTRTGGCCSDTLTGGCSRGKNTANFVNCFNHAMTVEYCREPWVDETIQAQRSSATASAE